MYSHSSRGYRPPRKRRWPQLLLLIVLGLGVWWYFGHRTADAPEPPEAAIEELPPKPDVIDLQPTIDAWLAERSATYGILIYDPVAEQAIASHNPDRVFFSASLYKVFTAYLALLDMQNGVMDPNQLLLSGLSRKDCIEVMMRESNNPCGKALILDMGLQTLGQRAKAMGINNTAFDNIATTAEDSILILRYIWEQRDLNRENTAFLRDIMRVQDPQYRQALPKGAPEAIWDSKVGYLSPTYYHDIGIMQLPDGREYFVAMLSENNGSPRPLADFSATIYAALVQPTTPAAEI